MVTRGMLDKEILWELEDDWPSVRAKSAKVAHKRMERTKKGGGIIPCDQKQMAKRISPDKGLRAGMSMEQLAVAAFGVHE